MKKDVILIAGSTASGKSAFAINTAKETDALIINADSMQVYDVLNVLSARPQAQDLAKAEHVLYGEINPAIRFSTGEWFRRIEQIIKVEKENQRPLIFVGGTGLYFNALTDGFTKLPDVPEQVVKEIEAEVVGLSRAERIELLKQKDPQMVERLPEPDRQRLVRVLSVIKATGKSLAYWQRQGQSGLLGEFNVEKFVLNSDKEMLLKRIENRFNNMINEGAIEEVRALNALALEASLPVMKAIGVKEITAMLMSEISQDEAIEKSIIATRQYAKRQRTWFRKRMKDWNWI